MKSALMYGPPSLQGTLPASSWGVRVNAGVGSTVGQTLQCVSIRWFRALAGGSVCVWCVCVSGGGGL